MKQRLLATLLSLCLLVGLLPTVALAAETNEVTVTPASDDLLSVTNSTKIKSTELQNEVVAKEAEEETPEETKISLENKYDVYALADIVNGVADTADYGEFTGYYPSDAATDEQKREFIKTASYVITSDMTLSSEDGFQGIGAYSRTGEKIPFSGSIDGQNHTITFDINSADYYGQFVSQYFAFVGYYQVPEVPEQQSDGAGETATVIENLNFTGEIVLHDSFSYAAAAVGYLDSGTAIRKIHSDADITNYSDNFPRSRVGGLVGCSCGTISDVTCYSDLTSVNTYDDNGWAYVGGICAFTSAGSVIQNAIFDGTLTGSSVDTTTAGLITAYTDAKGGSAEFQNIVVSGEVKLASVQKNTDSFLYYGALGGRTNDLKATDIVVHDTTIEIANNCSQARVGALIAGAHENVVLDDCIIKDCAIITGGSAGNNYQIGGVIGYAPFNLTMNNIISNCQLQIVEGSDLGTGYYLAGFASNASQIQNGSSGNLFSANKADFLSASRIDHTDVKYSKGIAGFYATEKLVVGETGSVQIAENSSNDKENSKLNTLDICWGYRDEAGTLLKRLPVGMSVAWDNSGNIATLTTSGAKAGEYTLVPYVTRNVAGQYWDVELADIAVSVQGTPATVSKVDLTVNGGAVNDPVELQAMAEKSIRVDAAVTLEGGSVDTDGVLWKFYDANSREVTPEYLAQYLTITVDGNSVRLTPDRIFQSASNIELTIKAVSVADPTKTDEMTLTLKPLLVQSVTLEIDEGAVGSGTEKEPYVLYTGQVLGGYGYVTMTDGDAYDNQRLGSTGVEYIVSKNRSNNQTVQPSFNAMSGRVTFTAKAEGLVKVFVKSVTPGSEGTPVASEPIYIHIKAPVNLKLTSSITGNTVSIARGNLGKSVGTLTASATVSATTLYTWDPAQAEIAAEEYSDYREPTDYTIASSDESIATLDEYGNIMAHNFGTVTFTAAGTGMGADGNAATAQYTLQIKDSSKKDQTAPVDLTGVATSHYDQADGSITGLSAGSAYEYRLSTEDEYTSVATGSTSVTGLAAGTYLVRLAGSETANPSADTEVTIAVGPKYDRGAPTGLGVVNASSATSENGQITGVDSTMEYALSYSNIFRPITGDTINGLTVGTYLVRYKATDHYNASAAARIEIQISTAGSGSGTTSSFSGDYLVTVDRTTGGKVTVNPSRADKGDTVTITVKPDTGYELDKLIVTDKNGDTMKLTNKGNGKFTFTMPGSKVEITATFVEITEEQVNPFSDVTTNDYYYDAVLWAVENGVTNGSSATTFSPNVAVSRAQMVTFLWRAHGSPKATGTNPFTDVSTSDYYYDAVLWAAANGVTTGTSATTFSPDMDVTRAQAVTFQWRAAGSDTVSGSSFGDVATDAWYVNAVTWAVANGITNGTGGNAFSPDVVVSRAQAVTFLYRELG